MNWLLLSTILILNIQLIICQGPRDVTVTPETAFSVCSLCPKFTSSVQSKYTLCNSSSKKYQKFLCKRMSIGPTGKISTTRSTEIFCKTICSWKYKSLGKQIIHMK
uniref:Cnidarian restricted protein n=1 Tax=Clytia hemisphaerica TaxID=252671 RepID=A0A7M5V7P1_9CNID